jgi:hypothetical protein
MDCTTHIAHLWRVDMTIGTPEDPGMLVLTACPELESPSCVCPVCMEHSRITGTD